MSDRSDSQLQRPGVVATRYSKSDKQTIIFYTTPSPQILALSRTQDTPPGGGDNFRRVPDATKGSDLHHCPPPPPPPPSVQPFIQTPGQLAAMPYNYLNCVYGIRIDNYITQLSPANFAYKKARTCDGYSALAAAGNGSNQGWLYFATAIQGAAFLTQFDLTQQQVNTNLPVQTQIDPTFLSAFYESQYKQRWIIYQQPASQPGADNYPRCIQIEQGKTPLNSGPITNANAILQSPTSILSNGTYVFLYYLQKAGNSIGLGRVQRHNSTSSSDPWNYGNVSAAPFDFNPYLQISAVLLPSGVVRIFQEDPDPAAEERFRYVDDDVPKQ